MAAPPVRDARTSCAVCGRTVEGQPPLAWSSSVGPRGTSWVCEQCTRQHVRSIEAGLAQEDW